MKKQDKLLILDKDGPLVRPASGAQFPQGPEDQVLLPGVADTLARYRDTGWVMAIASNQGGVAREHKTLGNAIDEMFFAMRLTNAEVAMAAHSYEDEYGEAIFLDLSDGRMFWRPVTNRNTRYRKPWPGMINYLASWIFDGICPDLEILFVGDRPEDQGAAGAAGVRFAWAKDWVESNG